MSDNESLEAFISNVRGKQHIEKKISDFNTHDLEKQNITRKTQANFAKFISNNENIDKYKLDAKMRKLFTKSDDEISVSYSPPKKLKSLILMMKKFKESMRHLIKPSLMMLAPK